MGCSKMVQHKSGSNGAHATVMAGVPATNLSFYRRIRFNMGDPAAIIEIPGRGSTLILRDLEMEEARAHARADALHAPAEFPPTGWGDGGLSGDRETATAQATAEFLRREGVKEVITDRSLPMIYAHMIELAGVRVICDTEMGILDRRQKDEQEIEFLRKAQRMTEGAMERACAMVGKATAGADGALSLDGAPLTSERIRSSTDIWLLERGFQNEHMIVTGGPQGAVPHFRGEGQIYTGQLVTIDIFPKDMTTLYNGDCTRTAVHGDVPDELEKMHKAVVEAKAAATAATKAGATGEDVHKESFRVITEHGYQTGLPKGDWPEGFVGMVHGTGHGIGLSVHEPPLLDFGGPELLVGDALTIEPGLYGRKVGGVRVEDMVIVTQDGCDNLNSLPEGLDWS